MEYHITLHALSGREPPRRSLLTLFVRPGSGDQFTVRLQVGAMGESCQPREWSHHTMADAVDQMREIVTAQLENGFRVVTVSRDHPIREWLDSEQVRDDVETPREGARKAGQLTLF